MNAELNDVFIILPGYNEEKHAQNTILELEMEGYKNIIFIDDGSMDKTANAVLKTNATLLKHKVNLGKGAATKTGCDYAISKGAKIIILMDSDGQHEAKYVKKFIKALKNKDIVFSYRKFDENMPKMMKLGNIFLSTASNMLFNYKIKDTQAGFRAFTTDAYKKIRWHSNNYAMESEMIARAAKHKLKYDEIEIKTIYHDKHKGTTPLDGPKVLFNMMRFKFFD
ncbi:MAG: glycosyltransferase family 2 protein [Candidatus Woesearchaeota archaeon]